MHNVALFLAIGGGIILTVGDIVLKKWVTTSYNLFYFLGIFLYFISMNFLAQSYKYEDVAIASMMMIIFNITTLTLVGYFVFKENITVYEIAGIFLGMISLFLLEFGKK